MKDFPLLKRKVHGKRLIYLDNAATTQKPKQVIKAMTEFYTDHNANVHRGVHLLSEEATTLLENARSAVAKFIGARTEEIIFTKNATESLNLAIQAIKPLFTPGDEIILSLMEHHSCIVPWQLIAKECGLILKYVPLNKDFTLDLEAYKRLLSKKTKVVSIMHVSNVLGTINPIKEIVRSAKTFGALTMIDGAQAVGHMPVNVKNLDCDFYAFSAHKMYGPMGVGVLYAKKGTPLSPFITGGGTIKEVTIVSTTFAEGPAMFEAGTLNVASIVGLQTAIAYLDGKKSPEAKLADLLALKLCRIPNITVYRPPHASAIVSFSHPLIHPHDLAQKLDMYGIAVRAGHHCAQPLLTSLGVQGTCRVSFALYNTKKDVDEFMKALLEILRTW